MPQWEAASWTFRVSLPSSQLPRSSVMIWFHMRAEEQKLSLLKAPLSSACSLVLPVALTMTLLFGDLRPACFSAILGPSFLHPPHPVSLACSESLTPAKLLPLGPLLPGTPPPSLSFAFFRPQGKCVLLSKVYLTPFKSVPIHLCLYPVTLFISLNGLPQMLFVLVTYMSCVLWFLLCENRVSPVSFTSFPKHTSCALQGHLLEDPQGGEEKTAALSCLQTQPCTGPG